MLLSENCQYGQNDQEQYEDTVSEKSRAKP